VHDFHAVLLHTRRLFECPSRGGQGETGSLTLVLDGNNPRFPWKPPTTMLTYKLNGTTEHSGSTAADTTSVHPDPIGLNQPAERDAPNLRAPWCAGGAALLTCGDVVGTARFELATP
jgi:hypothetical protein